MTDYDLIPKNSGLSKTRLYGDSMQPIQRGQTHPTEKHQNITGGTSSDSVGLEAGEIRIAGVWLGSDAKALADRLKAILNDQSVTRVEIDSVGTTTELDGDYRLTGEESINRVAADSDNAWEWSLTLIEE